MRQRARSKTRLTAALFALLLMLGVGAAVVGAADAAARSLPRAKLGRPHFPGVVVSGESFDVWGTLRPRHAAGAQSVQIRCYYKDLLGGGWELEKTVWATNENHGSYTHYTATMTLDAPGYPVACRLQAYAPADSKHRATTSSYAYGSVVLLE